VCVVQVTQLTGFSDPVYAEAYVHVNQYDIVLDVLVVNQTNDTLQNLTVELATLGQLLLCISAHTIHISGEGNALGLVHTFFSAQLSKFVQVIVSRVRTHLVNFIQIRQGVFFLCMRSC